VEQASQIISGLKIASLNSRVFCSHGMGQNVAVLHVDDYNFASGLLIFLFFLFFISLFFYFDNFIFFDFLDRQVLLLLIMLVPVLSIQYYFFLFLFLFTCCFFFKFCFMLEHLCVDLEQESKEAIATWVLVQIYSQFSLLCLYVLADFSF
jgi:hypothetical protein